MESNLTFWVDVFSAFGWIGAVLVIFGVVLESSELIIAWGKKRSFRKWISDRFLRSRRRMVVWVVMHLQPRILPYETIGFVMLFIGLAIELIGSGTAERMQSKENAILHNLAATNEVRVAELTNQTVRLSVELEVAKSNNWQLAKSVFGIAEQTKQMGTNIEQIRTFVNSPEISAKLNETLSAMARANKTIADAQNLLTNSAISQLKLETPDRSISPEQESILVKRLKPYTQVRLMMNNDVEVRYEVGDFEASKYAMEINECLRKCGFDSNLSSSITLSAGSGQIPTGLVISCGGNAFSYLTPNLKVIVDAFKEANIPVKKVAIYTNRPEDGIVHIAVWHKPEK